MKRFLSLICVFLLIIAVVSCGGDKKVKPAYEEQVTKEVSSEEGGKVESKDGKTSIEIPGGALDSNTTITMRIYDAKGYVGTEGQKVVSKVVEFEPSGLVFKKPVIITMAATEEVKEKVFSAAVYRESTGEWSYSEEGAYALLSDTKDAAGDPIMTNAAGDPIMLNAAGDPIMMSAAGDPIMMAAAGDPIMLASAGDPIMSNAAGDPIMNAAAGDPIMMTTGHFTAYTFIVLDSAKSVEEPDDTDDTDDSDTEEPVDDGDSEPAETDEDDDVIPDEDDDIIPDEDDDIIPDEDETPAVDEDVVPEPTEPPVYSKVLCTGQTRCSDGESIIDCPKPGEDFYGQDAQFVATKTCVAHKYSRKSEPVEPVVEEEDPEGSGTGLRNILHGDSNNKNIRKGIFRDGEAGETYEFVLDENTGLKWVFINETGLHAEAESRCAALTYGGHEWRLPTVKEFLSISDHDRFASTIDEYYFRNLGYNSGFWTSDPALAADGEDTDPYWAYNSDWGTLDWAGVSEHYGSTNYSIACVNGEVYGKPGEYEVRNIGGKEVVFDPSTNLLWQKDSVPVDDWKSALAYCRDLNYAGYSDWRLPNKNELVTIVDYSKVNPASSFPGMTSDTLVSSTFTVAYGGAENAIAVKMDSGSITEYYEEMSVRCVRSSSYPQPAGIPDCDESRIAPCKDAATGYVWSSAALDSNYTKDSSWLDTAIQCLESNEGGISKWRIPTIDEVRTLLTSSENLKTGGECKVTNECFDYASEACFNEECSPEAGGEMIRSSLFDYSGYLTGTLADPEDSEYAWFVNLREGSLERQGNSAYIKHESRCIKDDSLPDPVEFPYEDPASGLVWSDGPRSDVYWYQAAAYCQNLVEGESNNWRVPTMEEVRTLVRNCSDNEGCMPDTAGKYSVFGELSTLWSSTILTEESKSYFTALNFITASQVSLPNDYEYERGKVHCVRSVSDPETVSELEFPFEIGDLIWSKVSDEEYYSASAAAQYCESLNTERYGGYGEDEIYRWELPSNAQLAALIKKSVCSNKNDLLSGSSGRCNQYTFEGYSVFDDMIQLASSNGYVDFARGYVSYANYPSGFARCIVVLPDSGS